MIDYIQNVEGTIYPEEDLPPNARKLLGFIWRGEEKLNSVEDLFAGEEEYELTPIRGIPLPEEEEGFFENGESEKHLLNEKSRLRLEDLQERAGDTIPGLQENTVRDSLTQPEPLIEPELLDSLPANDTIQPGRNQEPRPETRRDTISPAAMPQQKKK